MFALSAFALLAVPAHLPSPAATERLQNNLAVALKDLFLSVLPDPLFEDAKHWGQQERNLRGQMKNHGRWWKLRIEGRRFPTGLNVRVVDLKPAGKDRQTFILVIDMNAQILLERQTWLRGVRLYSGSTRARVELHMAITCEMLTRFVTPKGALLPEVVFRLRVVDSQFRYDKLVVEHTAGVGGDAAELLGDAVISIVKQVKPSLERKLFDKAKAAVLKAGDSKELRIGINGVTKSK